MSMIKKNKKIYLKIIKRSNRIKKLFFKKQIELNKKMSIMGFFNINLYYFFNSIININYYLFYFHKLLSKFRSLYFLYKFNIQLQLTQNFFVNLNLNSIIKNTKLYVLKTIREMYFWPVLEFFVISYSKMNIINNYYSLQKSIRTWFFDISKKEKNILNINNILIYISEIMNSIIFFNKFYIKDLWFLYIKSKKIFNVLSFFNIKDLFIFYTILLNKNYYRKLNKIFVFYKKRFSKSIKKYIINIVNIYSYYMKTYNIINKYYTKFSFQLKKKVKEKINIFLKKRFNFIYFLNNLIHKFNYYFFLYWINVFLNFINHDNCLFNKIEKFNTSLLLNQVYHYYYEKKRNKTFIKTRFLSYYQPCFFLLYLNDFNKLYINGNGNEN